MEEQSLKKIMYGLIAVAVLMAGALAYVWWQKSSLVNELTIDKEELTRQMIDLQNDYATLSSDYDTINSQLDSSREEVSQLIERINAITTEQVLEAARQVFNPERLTILHYT